MNIPLQLITVLNSIVALPEECIVNINEILEIKTLKKNSVLEKEGRISKNIYFIEKGLFRSYFLVNSVEVSSWFMKENDIIISVKSFFQQCASNENIQALEDSIVHYISYENYELLCEKYPSFALVARKLTENYYVKSEERIFHLHQNDSISRYLYLLENHREILLRVPLKYLASYLNITVETLSRIRASH